MNATKRTPVDSFQDMEETYSVVYFWLEVVLQFVIGIAGFVANVAVIPILCR